MTFEEWLKQQPPAARLWPYVKHVREAWDERQKEVSDHLEIIGKLNEQLVVSTRELKSLEEVLEATRKNMRSLIAHYEEEKLK